MKKVAIFDVDGTIFRSSLLIELVEALIAQNVIKESTKDEYEAQHKAWLNRQGTYDEYIEAVVVAYLRNIKGVKYDDFKKVAEGVIEAQKSHVYRYTRDLVRELKEQGHFILAISQSPKTILDPFCKHLGFDKVYGRLYELDEENRFTGDIVNLEVIRNKANTVKRAVEVEGLTLGGSVGVGDSEDDIAFLEMVDTPICFNPAKKLYEAAKKHGWKVVVERKNVIYEL